MDKKTPAAKKKARPKKPAAYLTIDSTNMIGWLISCFIICGCMFFLGVLVGRNTAPVQFDVDRLEEKLSRLQDSVLKQKEAEIPETQKPSVPAIISDMAELEELPLVHENIIDTLKEKGREPEIYEQYVPPVLTPKYAKTPPSAPQTPAPAETKPAAGNQIQAEDKKSASPTKPVAVLKPELPSAPEESPAPVVKPETATAAIENSMPPPENDTPPAPAAGGFAIQVASLKDPEKARLLMNKFKEKGYPAFCQSSEVNGATWHRVRIGPYPDRALAEKDRNRLNAAGVDSLIISNN